jgi:hypothetical protein
MTFTPSYCRARLDVIHSLIQGLERGTKNKGNDIVLLRSGVVPDRFEENRLIREKILEGKDDNTPLTFSELTRFNTWFTLHPEKICGKEQITTSIEFPIKVKGTREDIEETIRGIKSLSELEMMALAAEVELQLIQL